MLDPDHRTLYTDALRPPSGFQFAEGVAATYSLDLETLLTIPLHLTLFSSGKPVEELLGDGVALLESLRRTTEGVTVYAQASRLHVPGSPLVLYGLLEPAVVEVMAPAEGGAFHPKLWLLRFEAVGSGESRLRLLVLTRNLTEDRSWDLALTLEGEPGPDPRPENQDLADLVERLPDLAARPPDPARRQATRNLADLAHRTHWEPPHPFEQVRFHATGLQESTPWLPEASHELVAISPFLSEPALDALVSSTREPLGLVSRPEELAAVDPDLLSRFHRVMTLREEAEKEDGEDAEAGEDVARPGHGLHAKAYLARRGWYNHVYVGSANATYPALVGGINVELVAELVGRRKRMTEVRDLLQGDGFGSLLADYVPGEGPEPPDEEVERARRLLDRARNRLAASGLTLRFSPGEEGWSGELLPEGPVELPGVSSLRAWFITRKEETAVSADALFQGRPAPLPETLLAHLTSFVAFELSAEGPEETVRFVLSLPAEGLPVEERDAAIVRDVIRNRDGFLRYVLLLLAEAGESPGPFGRGGAVWDRIRGRGATPDDLPLFEHLTRVYCQDPDHLQAVKRLLDDLRGDGTDPEVDVVPPEFLELWAVFEEALDLSQRERAG